MSGDMDGQIRNGTWEALADPLKLNDVVVSMEEKSPTIRKRKAGKSAGWRMGP
jgi:hypothetical protein